jgi:hypothetical protein
MTEHTAWVTLSAQELKDFFWSTLSEGIAQGHPLSRVIPAHQVFRDALSDAGLKDEVVEEITEVVFPKKG